MQPSATRPAHLKFSWLSSSISGNWFQLLKPPFVTKSELLDLGILIAATEAAATATSGCLACHGDSAAAQLQVLPLVPSAAATRRLGWPGQRVALAARAPSERAGARSWPRPRDNAGGPLSGTVTAAVTNAAAGAAALAASAAGQCQ